MDFIILKHQVLFINLKLLSKEASMFYLTKLVYQPPEFLNFHYNGNDQETSILISEDGIYPDLASVLPLEGLRKYYCACILNTHEYIDDTGLVKKLSTIFGEENIPILYITTFNNNFILFEASYYDRSVQILHSITKPVYFPPLEMV